MARYTCWKCGSGYDGVNCPVCAINKQTEEAADQASRDQERATAAMEAAVSEQTERLAEEMARSREAAEELAFEAAEEQRRALAESNAERKRIAANAWRLQAQAKADQAYRLFQSGLLAEALDLALKAFEEDRGNIDAVFVAGASLNRLGKPEEAHPYFTKQVQMLNMPEYQVQMKFHSQVLHAIGSDPALSKACCKIIRDNLPKWPSYDSIKSVDQLVSTLIEREEYELAVLVQQWMLRSAGVRLAALISTRKTFHALAESSGGLDAARPELEQIIEWLETADKRPGARRPDATTDRISLLALAFSLEFASILSTRTDALDSYFKTLSFEKRGDFEQDLKNLAPMVPTGEVGREAFSGIMDSAKRKYSSWEPDLRSQISNSVVQQVRKSQKSNFGCLAGLVWFFTLGAIQIAIPVLRGSEPSFTPPWGGLLAWGAFLGMIVLGKLTANTIRSFRRRKMARERLETTLNLQNEAFEQLGLPRISAPTLILRSPETDLAISSAVAIALLIGWCWLVVQSTHSASTPNAASQPYNGKGIEDDLAGHSAGNAFGIQWINAIGNRGAVFSAANSSRIEYPGFIPPEGTLEFWIKVDRGYQYVNSVFKPNQDDAMIFSSDVQGGDVTWPGTTTVYLSRNGSLRLWMATVKGPNHIAATEARATRFSFGQWHAIGVSYGSQGQYIMLDGKLVASAPGRTQTFGAAGTQESPSTYLQSVRLSPISGSTIAMRAVSKVSWPPLGHRTNKGIGIWLAAFLPNRGSAAARRVELSVPQDELLPPFRGIPRAKSSRLTLEDRNQAPLQHCPPSQQVYRQPAKLQSSSIHPRMSASRPLLHRPLFVLSPPRPLFTSWALKVTG